MKTYFVKTSNKITDMPLCSLAMDEFETKSIKEANQIFEKEEKCLSDLYRKGSDLNYSPTEHEMRHAITCSIVEMTGEGECFNIIKTSDHFFDDHF